MKKFLVTYTEIGQPIPDETNPEYNAGYDTKQEAVLVDAESAEEAILRQDDEVVKDVRVLEVEKILHLTPSTNGYEEVYLVANRISRNNGLAMIYREGNGGLHYTGGLLLNDTPQIRQVLDGIDEDRQYDFVVSIKSDPFIRAYYEE